MRPLLSARFARLVPPADRLSAVIGGGGHGTGDLLARRRALFRAAGGSHPRHDDPSGDGVQILVGPWTGAHNAELSRLQRAASQLVPGACSIALSIRELVRQAYLYSAMILLRPLVGRVGALT